MRMLGETNFSWDQEKTTIIIIIIIIIIKA